MPAAECHRESQYLTGRSGAAGDVPVPGGAPWVLLGCPQHEERLRAGGAGCWGTAALSVSLVSVLGGARAGAAFQA